MKIIPAVLAHHIETFEERLAIAMSVSDEVQIDVIDGQFADNMTLSLQDIATLPAGITYEAHLMVTDPLRYLPEVLRLGIARVAIHVEIEWDLSGVVRKYKEAGMFVLLALSPSTGIDRLSGLINEIDGVLIMSVVPGYGGQVFMPEVLEKVTLLRHLDPAVYLEIDGGVDEENIVDVAAAGIDAVVIGSAIIAAPDHELAYQHLFDIVASSD